MAALAAINGRNAYIAVGGTDVSGQSNRISIQPKKTVDTYVVFGDNDTYRIGQVTEWTGSARAVYTETAAQAFITLWTAYESMDPVLISTVPKGSTAGNWKYTGSAIITTAPIEVDRTGGTVVVEFAFEGHGALTRGTV